MIVKLKKVEPNVDFYNLFIDSLIREYSSESTPSVPFQKRNISFMEKLGIILYVYENSRPMLI